MSEMGLGDRGTTDGQLVARARDGDAAAFAELVRRFAPMAFGTARSRVRDRATASDVVQEAFTAAFERLRSLRTPERFGPWLRKLVIAQCARLARQESQAARGSHQVALLRTGAVQTIDPPDENDGELARASVRLIERLPPAQREAATLCLVRGVSGADAARFLGVGEGALRKRLHDARRKLQAQVFRLARDTFREDQLPPGFAERCACRCERSRRKPR